MMGRHGRSSAIVLNFEARTDAQRGRKRSDRLGEARGIFGCGYLAVWRLLDWTCVPSNVMTGFVSFAISVPSSVQAE